MGRWPELWCRLHQAGTHAGGPPWSFTSDARPDPRLQPEMADEHDVGLGQRADVAAQSRRHYRLDEPKGIPPGREVHQPCGVVVGDEVGIERSSWAEVLGV